jgi:hypothetical protein
MNDGYPLREDPWPSAAPMAHVAARAGNCQPFATWRLSLVLTLAYILLGAPGVLLGSPAPAWPTTPTCSP